MLIPFALAAGLVARNVAAKQGMVGYGINMYHPWCCTPCSDSLEKLYLSCTTFNDTSMSSMGSMGMSAGSGDTSSSCYASNRPFQQTLAYCIKSHCDADSLPYDQQNTCFQSKNYAGSSGPSLAESLPMSAPSQQLAMDAMWLNETMLVNEAMYTEDRQTISLFEEIEVDHVSWSIAIFVVSVAIPLLTGLYLLGASRCFTYRNLYGGLFSTWHSLLALPALGTKRLAEPFRGVGYVPSRAMSLWITLYIVINVFASSCGFRSVQPNTYFTTRSSEMAAYVGNRAGVLSFANLALSMLFSMRNNPLLYLSGWDMPTQLAFHRWSARVSVLQAVVHSIVYTADYTTYKGSNMLAMEAAMGYWWWGVIATVAMSLMVGLSAFYLRTKLYEFFLVSHILLAIVSLIGCWYHIIQRFQKQWGYEKWLYIASAFWAYDRLLRVLTVAYHHFTKKPVAHLEAVDGTNVVSMTIELRKNLAVGPGRHLCIHFPSLTRFWESHPFTVCDWSEGVDFATATQKTHDSEAAGHDVNQEAVFEMGSKGRTTRGAHVKAPFVRLMFRSHKGMTSTLRSRLSPGKILTTPVFIDGPYGGLRSSHLPLETADAVLCIAGGIGITHASSFTRQFVREHSNLVPMHKRIMPACKSFTLAWSVRENALLEHGLRHVVPHSEMDDDSLKCSVWLTGSTEQAYSSGEDMSSMSSTSGEPPAIEKGVTETTRVHSASALPQRHYGRMDVSDMVASAMNPRQRLAVIVCGPGSLSDAVRSEVVKWAEMAYVVDLLNESFAW